MLYLRNTNQVQTLEEGLRRGVANVCCSPTLDSVVSASFTQLYINSTLGNYLVNCKSCVGEYIQVTENSGSTWTTINPGNCSSTNLVPMPSQSAYYRLFTSCSATDQPFDPLTSSFSNEILYVPNSRLHYKFEENGADAIFTLDVTGSTLLSISQSQTGDFYEIPSASVVSASVESTNVPYTGSTSMSLWITGSNVSYYTSSCVFSGSSIFLGDGYVAIPHEDYDVTASIDHQPGRTAVCGDNVLGYTVDSLDVASKIWYPANSQGTFTSASTSYGFITGSVSKSNIETGDCRFNTVYMSGSATFDLPTPGPEVTPQIYIAIVSGSFTLTGTAGTGFDWSIVVGGPDTVVTDFGGTFDASGTNIGNEIVSVKVGTFVAPFNERELSIYIGGTLVAQNPPTWQDGPYSLGETFTLTGEGYIRSFGYGGGDQSYYDCYYEVS